MPETAHTTRFAPSPTGSLHLGNARTALFSWLAARASGGRFVLRVEDTDAERSHEALLDRQLAELRWLGLDWDEGPDVGGEHGPYRQSERAPIHAQALDALAARGLTYRCFCSPEELEFSRKAQLAAGRPPRYARTCANLGAEEVQRRLDAGKRPAVRFRVPDRRVIEFTDQVHGPQRFLSDDIGDFVIARADGSVSFFLGNAIDDSAMGITLVIRGDDHLANTPRQLLILEALGMRQPAYAHLPLVLAVDGRPLSKREGAASLSDLHAHGYLPGAVRNYLARLGHACGTDAWLDTAALPRHFDIRRTSHSAARFDEAQLRHWQREAVTHASDAELERWLAPRLEPLVHDPQRQAFVAAVRGNVLFPADVDELVAIVAREDLAVSADAAAQIVAAGAEYFGHALAAFAQLGDDFKGWTRAIAAATGRKGAQLYMPLRSALTGTTHGPELAPLVALMGADRARHRLAAAQARAAGN
ncbi:MAG TPA: glutamate--tRNA ligase [Steroidobacteraceae bacterium]|nr:glutamate--tRNA ligase [Steroidobacteraceae bacterium]